MLRFKVLSVLFLGVLASCAVSEPEAPASGALLEGRASALTTTVPGGVMFNGSQTTSCFNCRAPDASGYTCAKPGAPATQTFSNPLPQGAVLTGVTAQLYGRCETADNDGATVTVSLNTVSLGAITATQCSCGSCDAPRELTQSPSGGFPDYNYNVNGLNSLSLVVSNQNGAPDDNDTYCISHINLTLTYEIPGISVTPSSLLLEFGKQKQGTTSLTKEIVVTNTGNAILRVTPNFTSPFQVTPTGERTLVPLVNPSQTFTVTFAPGATLTGAQEGTVTFTHNVPNTAAVEVDLTGEAVTSAVDLSQTVFTFPAQRVGTPSDPQPLTVRNAGGSSLQVTSIVFSNPAFSVTDPAAFTLAAGASKTLSVVFTPGASNAGQTVTGTLTLTTPGETHAPVSLTGTAVQPALQVVGTTLAFNEHQVGTTPLATQTFTLRNSGSGTLTVNVPASVSAYTISPNGSRDLTPEDGAQTYTVTFTPTAATAYNANLVIGTNVGTNTSTTVALSGTGVIPALTASTNTVSFNERQVGTTPPPTQTFTLRNSGSGTLTVNVPASVSAYTISPNGSRSLRPEDGAQTYTVTFTPTAATAYNANLVIGTSVGTNTSTTVALTGTGVTPTLELVGTTLAFDEQQVGQTTPATRTFTVRNTSSGTLNLNVPASVSRYTISPNGPVSLRSGDGLRTYTVTFNPTASETSNADLDITSDEVGRPTATVRLTGTGVTPTLELVGTALVFGEHRVGAMPRVTRTFTLRNTSTGTLNVNVPASATGYTVSPSGAASLRSGDGPQTYTVTFNPTSPVAYNTSLSITSNDGAMPAATVTLTGAGIRPVLAVPASVEFNQQRVGAVPSETRQVRVTNNGNGPIQITEVAITADRPFTVSSIAPFDLPAQSHHDLTVTFTPTATGPFTAALTLTTNDTEFTSATVALTGTGVRPTLALSSSSLTFNAQRVGTTSAAQELTLRNSGDGMLTVTVPATVSVFSITPNGTFQLGPNVPQVVRVAFNPDAVGDVSASLQLATNQVSQANHFVTFTGTGVRPQLELSPPALSFGAQRAGSFSQPQVVTVRNRGNGPVRVTGVNVTAGTPFMVSSTAPFNLDPDQAHELSVTFSPSAKGPVSASLTLSTDEAISSANPVSLSGTGTTGLDLDPENQLDFGNVPRDTPLVRQVRLINSSSVPVTISSISSLPQVFTVTGIGAGTVVPARSPITFDVTFRPTAQGQVSAALSITSNADNSPHSLTLVGTGTVPVVKLSLADDPAPPIASLPFGGVRVTATKQLVVRLTNVGQAPLIFSGRPTLGTSPSVFAYLGTSTPPTLEPNTSFDFPVSFRPEQAINYSDTLTIPSNVVGGTTALSLSGLGAFPELRLDRTTPIFFGDVRVGSRSNRVPVTINNIGNAEVSLQSLPVEGPYLVEFENATTQLPRPIAARSSFTFYVVFRPSTHADKITGSVSILTDIDNQTAPRVLLEGNGTISEATLAVAEIDFGPQRVRRASGAQPLIITNTGKAELEISQLTFSRNDIFSITSPNPLPTPANPLRIPAGEQQAISMNFTPNTLGTVEGRLFIISNAFVPAPNLTLKGLGVDGQMSLTPSVVRFVEGVQVGGAGSQLSVSLRNSGGSTLTITGVRAPENRAFSVSGLQPGLMLQPGDSWPFTVTFAPTARGYVASSTIIESDAVMNPAFSLALEGTGVAAAVELLPSLVSFGKSNVGVPTTQDISIKNVGEKDLYISNVSFTDFAGDPPGAALEYSVSGTTFPQTVEPGKSILVNLRFNPRVVGMRRARANVFTNAQTQAATAELYGEGTSPSLRLSSPRLDFGNVLVGKPSAPRPLTLTNTGSGPLTLQKLTPGGVDMAAFTITAPTLPLTLQPEASVEVSVSLTPDADRAFSAQLLVESDSSGAPSATVGLSGTGVRQQLQVSPALVDFGQQLLNNRSTSRTVSISNSSDTNITLASLSVEGAESSQFSLVSASLPRVLGPGDRLDVSVFFTPQSENALECQLKVAFNDLPTPFTVTLRGKGIPTVLSIRPNPLEFGAVRAGGPERDLPLTITNLSNEAIVLDAPSITSTGAPFVIRDVVRDRTLAAGTSTIVNVYYRPMTETLSEATMSFGTLSPPQPRSVNVQARGRAVARLLNVDPGDLVDFGRVDVGDPVPTRDIVIVNRSSQDQRVEVKLQSVEGTPFTVDAKALAEPIPAGGSVTVTVGFAPTEAGLVEGVVEVWLEDSIETTVKVSGIGRALMGQGGGCSCGTGGSGGAALMALLALVGMSVRRRRRE